MDYNFSTSLHIINKYTLLFKIDLKMSKIKNKAKPIVIYYDYGNKNNESILSVWISPSKLGFY